MNIQDVNEFDEFYRSSDIAAKNITRQKMDQVEKQAEKNFYAI